MRSWRDELATIRELIMKTNPEWWRADLYAISPNSTHWRESIAMWANDFGVNEYNWRMNLIGIAYELGAIDVNGWREALKWIAENYIPIELFTLLDSDSNVLFDSENYALFVRG